MQINVDAWRIGINAILNALIHRIVHSWHPAAFDSTTDSTTLRDSEGRRSMADSSNKNDDPESQHVDLDAGTILPDDIEMVPAEVPEADPVPPRTFGRYTIDGPLAEGGMGTVYRARQENPSREVALKVIRSGLATGERLKRFELEAQTLARLAHPGIATIFDAGTIDVGHGLQPFFAMELIDGAPIATAATERGLDMRARLELLAAVADAVHFAHQRGVIHRDLKPDNILVDAEGRPHVIDFGLARIIDERARIVTVETQVGHVMGTVRYMSPEQITGDPAAVDTRTDVYALGVIGYELLAGNLPIDVAHSTIADAARLIADKVPPRLGTVDARFRGDVETIFAMALAKEPDARYASAHALATDIRRYLNHETIMARPPSLTYQLRIFARRNRALTAALVGMVILLVAGVTTTSIGFVRAVDAKARQEREARKATEISRFLTDEILYAASPEVAQGHELSMREVIDTAAGRIRESLNDNPEARVTILRTLAETYRSLGDPERAEELYKDAIDIATKTWGAADRETLSARCARARVLGDLGKLRESVALASDAVSMMVSELGPNDPTTLRGRCDLGSLTLQAGDEAEAETILRDTIDRQTRVVGQMDAATLATRFNLAAVLAQTGRNEEAIEHYEAVRDAHMADLGATHPDTLRAANNLATTLSTAGRGGDAEQILRQTLADRRRVFGDDHLLTLHTVSNLGALLVTSGHLDDARPLLEEAVAGMAQRYGTSHPDTLTARNNLAYLLEDLGDLTAAEREHRNVFDERIATIGPDHPNTIGSGSNLAGVLHKLGRVDEAATIYDEVLTRATAVLPDGHIYIAIIANNYGDCLTDAGQFEKAERLLRESHDKLVTFGDEARVAKSASRLDRLDAVRKTVQPDERPVNERP
jgi:eukaryotic-like serine/threonine-protein kinase